jgi:hypothetical protein
LDQTTIQVRLVPSVSPECLGANNFGSNAIKFRWDFADGPSLFDIDQHNGFRGIFRVGSYADADNRRIS